MVVEGVLHVKEVSIIERGAIFCQVDKKKHIYHDKFDITWGNQKWKGTKPILIIRAVDMIKWNQYIWVLKSKSAEPNAWNKKYLIAASIS